MNPTPLGSRVLAKPTDDPSVIWVPETNKALVVRAIVIACGDRCSILEPGDEILLLGDVAVEFTLSDETLYVTDEEVGVLLLLSRNPTVSRAT